MKSNKLHMDGKTALITGGANGIGEATAYVYAEYGASKIALIDLADDKLKEVKENLKAISKDIKVCTFVSDVTYEEECVSILKEVSRQFGRLDAAVNCAGISQAVPLELLDMEKWKRMLSINLDATFLYCREAFKLMKAQKYGTIVNISSMGAQVGGVFAGAHYVASKGGVIALTKHVALAGAKYNVRCNCLTPSYIATPMMASLADNDEIVKRIPMGHQGTAEDVANSIMFFSSDLSAFSTGAILNINGGAYM